MEDYSRVIGDGVQAPDLQECFESASELRRWRTTLGNAVQTGNKPAGQRPDGQGRVPLYSLASSE